MSSLFPAARRLVNHSQTATPHRSPGGGRRRGLLRCGLVLLGAGWVACSASGTTLPEDLPSPPDLAPAGCAQLVPAQSSGCAAWQAAPAAGPLPGTTLKEISGLVVSRKNSTATTQVLWLHNDSGDGARVFAVAVGTGAPRLLATYTLTGVTADDWEDIAIGPAPGRSGDFLYIGDVGNNFNRVPRRTTTQIYRIPEPTVELMGNNQLLTVAGAERIDLTYQDGKPYDCEALLVDPSSGELVLLSKDLFGGPTYAYRLPPVAQVTGPTAALTPTVVTDCLGAPLPLNFPASERPAVTGADATLAGDAIVVRAYSGVFRWLRQPGESLATALGREACSLPSPTETQGEAIGLSGDGATYYTVSEGSGADIHVFRRN